MTTTMELVDKVVDLWNVNRQTPKVPNKFLRAMRDLHRHRMNERAGARDPSAPQAPLAEEDRPKDASEPSESSPPASTGEVTARTPGKRRAAKKALKGAPEPDMAALAEEAAKSETWKDRLEPDI